jgi:phenylpropionate dioxygenase-like ring-hydroxylating dioxygenase large terminal subunit
MPSEDLREFLDNDEPRLRRAWHPVARSTDIGPDPYDARLNGDRIRLLRRGPLPRRGHGLEHDFDPVDVIDGSVWGVTEQYGLVWIAQEHPLVGLPDLPEWFDPAYHSGVLCTPTHVGAGVLLDNFLDVTHFSYLHRQSFGRSRPVTSDGYQVVARGDYVRLEHDTVLQEGRRDRNGEFGQRRIATYTYYPPYIAHLQMCFPADGDRAAATLVCQPESATSTRAYVVVLIPVRDPGLSDQIAFSRRVLDEDLALVERMPDPRLCLSIRSELHTRADRASIEMRRTLSDFLDRSTVAKYSELGLEVVA